MKQTKKSLLASGASLLLSAALLAGSTFAWFTDSVTNTGNTIQAGTLQIDFQYRDLTSNGEFKDVPSDSQQAGALFTEDQLWEPGYSFGYDFKVRNTGTLAEKWELVFQNIKCTNGTNGAQLADVLDVYVIPVDAGEEALTAQNYKGTLSQLENVALKNGNFDPQDGPYNFSVVLKMQESASNDYQGAQISFDLFLRAKQQNKETDGFGSSDYDANAAYPVHNNADLVEQLENGGSVVANGKFDWTDEINITGEPASILNLEDNTEITVFDKGILNLSDSAQVTVQGSGKLIQTFESEIGYLMTVAGNSKLIIKDGTFIGGLTCVQAEDNAQVEIYGGHFEALTDWNDTYWLLNLMDNSNASIKVYGGTFVNFDPSNSITENPKANFVADGYKVVSEEKDNGDIWYTVIPE